ncbi:MAG: DNA (cytosine-5-)-methyltransferase [bacterium]|nr:DNA (cytosine-5-)-methyltransferase [bacterium]
MKFIDLFAGLGGFHVALKTLGHECVFACEVNECLAKLYKHNFNIDVEGDIRKIRLEKIPSHDILCAGFPCQPFSKAGKQEGRRDIQRGTLFDEIVRILEYHKPQYFILENVPFIKKHDNENTWNYIVNKLNNELNYVIDSKIYSPHQFGIPQFRERIFIIGSLNGLDGFKWPEGNKTQKSDAYSIIDKDCNNAKKIGKEEKECLEIWQEFLDSIPENEKIPTPLWSMEFGATYPLNRVLKKLNSKELGKYKGSFGRPLKGLPKEEQLKLLPRYAITEKVIFPRWKIKYIEENREFYKKNKERIKKVLVKIKKLKIPSWQKFEWNCNNGERIIKNYIIQFRGSGVRIKKTDFFPSLVCTNTQRPIIGWEERYLVKNEAAKLQSITGIKLPDDENVCFRALGNAVNTKIVGLITKNLIKDEKTFCIRSYNLESFPTKKHANASV